MQTRTVTMVTESIDTKNAEMLDRYKEHVAPTNARAFDIVAQRGHGSYLWDVDGERYLDFTSGIAVNNVGHCHPAVVSAVRMQIETLIHTSMVTCHTTIIELAEKLASIAPPGLNSVFLNNSGGEAIDAALKFARFVTGRPNIISFTGAFHGRTLLATALTTAKSYYREGYDPLPSGVYQVPYPYCHRCPVGKTPGGCALECFSALETLFKHQVKPHSVAAIIMEPVLGEGGYVVPATGYPLENGYMQRLRQLCDEYGILLVFDEVQSGFGRTGKWFATNHFDISPDIMVMAKGIASGFPMAGFMARKDLLDKWSAGRHGSTYGGNPVACAAALASIKVIETEGLLENARKMGERIIARLTALKNQYSSIAEIRGLGLMIGIEFVDAAGNPDGERLSKLVDECFKRKLLLLDCGSYDHVIRFLPPLNCSQNEVDAALDIFEDALAAIH
jgi:4-aminobutyrate aminotransferase